VQQARSNNGHKLAVTGTGSSAPKAGVSLNTRTLLFPLLTSSLKNY